MKSNLQPLERAQLREFLVNHFSQDELELLAFDLGVDYELLGYQNKQKLSLELVAYFERRNRLNCLLAEVICRRPQHNLAHLLQKVPACSPHIKIQIIAHTSPEVMEEIEAFLEYLAHKHNLNHEEVSLIAAAQGSLYLLLSLPEAAVNVLQQPGRRPSAYTVEVMPFASLPERTQQTWRMIALEWPPVILQNKLLPRIPWQKAAEIYRLKEKDRLIRTLVAGDQFGAHGTRVSLAALSGYAQLLAMTGELNDKQTSYVDKLLQASDDLSERLTVLYNLITPADEEVTIQSLLEYLLLTITSITEQAGVQLDLVLANELMTSQQLVRGSLILLTKSVAMLVQNGIKFSGENGRIRLGANLENDRLVLQVQDEGETIPAAEANSILDAYGQGSYVPVRDRARVDNSPDLPLLRLVVGQMDGKVWLQPHEGPGNIFCLSFPVKAVG